MEEGIHVVCGMCWELLGQLNSLPMHAAKMYVDLIL